MSEGGTLSEVSEVPSPSGPAEPAQGAAARVRLESEVLRLQRELELERDAMRALTARLRDAEREAAQASGATVVAMGAELAAWQDRARQAEAELTAIRTSRPYRLAAPALLLYRVRGRVPGVARRLLARLGG